MEHLVENQLMEKNWLWKIQNFKYKCRSFVENDKKYKEQYTNVRVHDITKLSYKKFKELINSKDATICAWCYGERSKDVIKMIE